MAESDRKAAGRYDIRDFILGLIDDYRYGKISGDGLCAKWEDYRGSHSFFYLDDEDLKRTAEVILPEACAAYMDTPETAAGRDLKLWKGLKDCEFLLHYGKTFAEDWRSYVESGRSRVTPVEHSDQYLLIEPELEQLIRAETGEGGWTGYCHTYWAVKKRILKERYDIDWESPADRYPGVLFD